MRTRWDGTLACLGSASSSASVDPSTFFGSEQDFASTPTLTATTDAPSSGACSEGGVTASQAVEVALPRVVHVVEHVKRNALPLCLGPIFVMVIFGDGCS